MDATSKDIDAYLKIHEILVIRLGETMIPEFKEKQLGLYSKILQ
jgi:hypothetical protein